MARACGRALLVAVGALAVGAPAVRGEGLQDGHGYGSRTVYVVALSGWEHYAGWRVHGEDPSKNTVGGAVLQTFFTVGKDRWAMRVLAHRGQQEVALKFEPPQPGSADGEKEADALRDDARSAEVLRDATFKLESGLSVRKHSIGTFEFLLVAGDSVLPNSLVNDWVHGIVWQGSPSDPGFEAEAARSLAESIAGKVGQWQLSVFADGFGELPPGAGHHELMIDVDGGPVRRFRFSEDSLFTWSTVDGGAKQIRLQLRATPSVPEPATTELPVPQGYPENCGVLQGVVGDGRVMLLFHRSVSQKKAFAYTVHSTTETLRSSGRWSEKALAQLCSGVKDVSGAPAQSRTPQNSQLLEPLAPTDRKQETQSSIDVSASAHSTATQGTSDTAPGAAEHGQTAESADHAGISNFVPRNFLNLALLLASAVLVALLCCFICLCCCRSGHGSESSLSSSLESELAVPSIHGDVWKVESVRALEERGGLESGSQ